jgi:hypothetical protein
MMTDHQQQARCSEHTMTDIDAATREAAISAVGKADRFLSSARMNLIGRRVPLAGTHYDADKALTELQHAAEALSEAIRLIKTAPPPGVEQLAKSGMSVSKLSSA